MPTATTTYQVPSTSFTIVELPVSILVLGAIVIFLITSIVTMILAYFILKKGSHQDPGCNGPASCNNVVGNHVKEKCPALMQKDFNHLLILFAVICVFIFTNILLGDDNAFDYISFASTITSIVLSVVAILMTISSESKTEGVKASIDDSVRKLEATTKNFDEYTKHIRDYEDKIDSMKSTVDTSIESLQETTASIVKYTEQMGAYEDKINALLELTETLKENVNRAIGNDSISIDHMDRTQFSEYNLSADEENENESI